jgi:hypothetical protein
MAYKRLTENIFIETQVIAEPKILNLSELEKELERLKGQLTLPEPTNEELMEVGRMHHTYFMDKVMTEMQIADLEKLISELKEL